MSTDELERAYWREAEARVGELTDHWLALEADAASAAGEELKRLLHTMKGEAHMLGLPASAELLRAMEETVLSLRGGGLADGVGDLFLNAVDVIAVMATNGGIPPDGLDALSAQLDAAAGAAPARAPDASPPDPPPREPSPEAEPEAGAPLSARLDPMKLSPLVHEALRIHLEQALIRPKLREVRRMLRALMAEMDPALGVEALAERIVKTLSYGTELERRMADLDAEWSNSEFALEMALGRIEESVRSAAVVSVGALEAQVHRTARAAAAALGKRVRVTVSGDAYVDATVERSLGPALLHLVRNAVDHGIESEAERSARGKPPEGRLDVVIHQSDSSVQVSVTDDGGGVDLDRLHARVEETTPGGAPHEEGELLQRIFDHGVSTRETTTEISGRGVGLDVVARQVRVVGGSVRVDSTRGVGTRFELVLPTMLRADVVVPVEVSGVRLALPARSVLEVTKVPEVIAATDGWRLRRGQSGSAELLPLFDLGALFAGGSPPEAGDAAIVLRHRTGAFAARVDGYHNPRALSFERVEELPIDSELIRGVAPAPDGGVFLLLDPDVLYDQLRGIGAREAAAGPSAARRGPLHVLVVEDAPVARELLLSLLRSFGMRVSDAADGRQGLEAARADPPDLILSDIEMPFLGGLEMIAELQRDPALAPVPVIVLTTRTDEEVRGRARDLGVRAFLSKQRFVEAELREVIRRCVAE